MSSAQPLDTLVVSGAKPWTRSGSLPLASNALRKFCCWAVLEACSTNLTLTSLCALLNASACCWPVVLQLHTSISVGPEDFDDVSSPFELEPHAAMPTSVATAATPAPTRFIVAPNVERFMVLFPSFTKNLVGFLLSFTS